MRVSYRTDSSNLMDRKHIIGSTIPVSNLSLTAYYFTLDNNTNNFTKCKVSLFKL